MPATHRNHGPALGRQLAERAFDLLQLPASFGDFVRQRAGVFDIGQAVLAERLLLRQPVCVQLVYQIDGNSIQISLWVPDQLFVADPQYPKISLLRKLLGIGLTIQASAQVTLQPIPVLGKRIAAL